MTALNTILGHQHFQKKPFLADGAMGSVLIAMGHDPHSCLAELNLTHPKTIQQIHRDYIAAGAQIIYTHSFQANRLSLAKYQKDNLFEQINLAAVHNAKQAASQQTLVAGNMGGIEKALRSHLQTVWSEQAQVLLNGGIDLLVVETITSLEEVKATTQLIGMAHAKLVPVVLSVTPQPNGLLWDSTPLPLYLSAIAQVGADMVGINCFPVCKNHDQSDSTDHDILNLATLFANNIKLPVVIKPNAGMPLLANKQWTYPVSHEEFAKHMNAMHHLPILIIGGCCGTTPETIRNLKNTFLFNQ